MGGCCMNFDVGTQVSRTQFSLVGRINSVKQTVVEIDPNGEGCDTVWCGLNKIKSDFESGLLFMNFKWSRLFSGVVIASIDYFWNKLMFIGRISQILLTFQPLKKMLST